MPFERPTLPELSARIEADFISRLGLTGGVLRRSVVKVLSRVIAGVAHGIYGFIEYLSRQFFSDTAETEWLERRASLWGIERKPATYASGDVIFTGTDTTVIPQGTELQRSDGVEFTTDSEVTISGGTATVSVTAVLAGSNGNTDAGVILNLVSPISGADSSATVDTVGIIDGNDQEDDESLRERVRLRQQEPPHGGAASDYVQWVLEVAGVTRAWVYPTWMGPGTVGVTFVLDDSDPIIPDAPKVQEVQDYIEIVKPVTADVTVFSPVTLEVDFTIAVTPDTTEVRAAVTAELQDLFTREGEPGAIIRLSNINEAISLADGEEYHTLVAPIADITPDANQIPILGTITWA